MNTIFDSTEYLIALINSEYIKFCSTDHLSTEFHVRASIYKENYSANVDNSLYIKVSNSYGTKFFVSTSNGDILECFHNDSFFSTPIGNVLNDDYGFSSFEIKSGKIQINH